MKLDKSVFNPLIAGAGTALADKFALQPLAAKAGLGISDEFIKILGGLGMTTFFKQKMLKNIGQALIVVGAYNLVSGFGTGLTATSGTVAIA